MADMEILYICVPPVPQGGCQHLQNPPSLVQGWSVLAETPIPSLGSEP